MKDVFALVKPACDMQGVLSAEASVNVVGGRMEAFNKFLTVSQPCDLPDFAAPIHDLDFALRKVTDPRVSVTNSNVMIKGGGTSRVPLAPMRAAFVKPDIETHKIADVADLLAVIDEVYPFTSGDPARPWSLGARFDDATVTATNSVMLCQATLANASPFEAVTISREALAYMRQRRDGLVSWGVGEKGILLEFSDGAWALAARMSMEMPDLAVSLIDNAIESWDDLVEVGPAYRASFAVAAEWAADEIDIYPDKIVASRLSSEHDEPADTALSTESAKFAADSLATVMSKAQSIAFHHFPKPVPFVTERGSRGLLAGRK